MSTLETTVARQHQDNCVFSPGIMKCRQCLCRSGSQVLRPSVQHGGSCCWESGLSLQLLASGVPTLSPLQHWFFSQADPSLDFRGGGREGSWRDPWKTDCALSQGKGMGKGHPQHTQGQWYPQGRAKWSPEWACRPSLSWKDHFPF